MIGKSLYFSMPNSPHQQGFYPCTITILLRIQLY
ncbi:hypothetical protein LINGRAPRIM_LOCUS2696 [Linum grandiflorum]